MSAKIYDARNLQSFIHSTKRNLASLSLPAFGGLIRNGGLGCNSALNTVEFCNSIIMQMLKIWAVCATRQGTRGSGM
jgi:hypothetical protein